MEQESYNKEEAAFQKGSYDEQKTARIAELEKLLDERTSKVKSLTEAVGRLKSEAAERERKEEFEGSNTMQRGMAEMMQKSMIFS